MARLKLSLRTCLLAALVVVLSVLAIETYLNEPSPEDSRSTGGLFAQFDRDGNGIARLSEVPRAQRSQFEFLLARAGLTQSGAITRAQFEKALRSPASEPAGSTAAAAGAPSGDNNMAEAATDQANPTPAADSARDGTGSRGGEIVQATIDLKAGRTQPAMDKPILLKAAGPAPRSDAARSSRPIAVPAGDAGVPHVRRRLFERLDTDHDGLLSDRELPDAFRKTLLRGDQDSDGRLGLVEFCNAIEQSALEGTSDDSLTPVHPNSHPPSG